MTARDFRRERGSAYARAYIETRNAYLSADVVLSPECDKAYRRHQAAAEVLASWAACDLLPPEEFALPESARSRTEEAGLSTELRTVPLSVALALVTGRRIDRREDEETFLALLRALAVGLDETSEAGVVEMKRRARLLFPAIAHETGREFDERRCMCSGATAGETYFCDHCLATYLSEKEALYGASLVAAVDVATLQVQA